MQKQNGFKMFERDMVNRGKLNSRDYADLATMGIKKEDSVKYFANLRRKDLSRKRVKVKLVRNLKNLV